MPPASVSIMPRYESHSLIAPNRTKSERIQDITLILDALDRGKSVSPLSKDEIGRLRVRSALSPPLSIETLSRARWRSIHHTISSYRDHSLETEPFEILTIFFLSLTPSLFAFLA